jgi:hypothetical protein
MDNVSNGGLLDRNDTPRRRASNLPRRVRSHLEAWQAYCGFDRHGGQARIEASLDPQTLLLTRSIAGDVPPGIRVAELHVEGEGTWPGPIALEPGRRVYKIDAGGPAVT